MLHLVGAVRACTSRVCFAGLGLAAACAAGGTDNSGLGGLGSGTGSTAATSGTHGSGTSGAKHSGSVSNSAGSGGNDLGNSPSSGSDTTSSGSSSGSASGGSPAGSSAGSSTGSPSSGGSSAGGTGGGSTGSPTSSGPSPKGSMPPNLPKVSGTCPMFANGATVTVSAGGGSIQAQIWMGSQGGGPIIIYWHGTASSPGGEIPIAFDTNAVAAAGGIIVGFNANSRQGATNGNTGDAVWYQSDGAFADQAVACWLQNNHGDPTHIHTAGYSAGGLQTVWMWFARSGYLASVISYSGGDGVINKAPLQDMSNLAPAIAAHGAPGSDNLGLDFANCSITWEMEIKQGGGFSIDCNDGGNHLDFFGKRAPGLKPVAFKFFQDHPFGVGKPDPYGSALPSGFPSYCKID